MAHSMKSRRELLKLFSAIGATGAVAPIALNLAAMSSAVASTASGYRALIYINLSGGNDTHNTVLATDPTSWQTYMKYRDSTATDGANSIALAPGALLPISVANAAGQNTGRSFALNPNLPNIQGLFAAKKAAVVANIGPMIQPITAAQYKAGSVPVPPNLFSHNSMTSTWQAFSGEGAQYGWGGHMSDALMSGNASGIFTSISANGNSVFLAGNKTTGLELGSSGLNPIAGLKRNGQAVTSIYPGYGGEAPDTTSAALNTILTSGNGSDLFATDVSNLTKTALDAQAQLQASLTPAYSAATPTGIATPPANNGLASQLQMVLRVMTSSSSLGVTRQVFYVGMGGFDTHDFEVLNHTKLMAQLDAAIGYFYTTAQALGISDRFVMFTGSEFGRTFTTNGDGCDHGWGAHHMVFGDSVKGGDIYGRFPTLGVNNTDNVGSALLPAISVEQYAATFATWMGVSDSSLNDIFPNLPNFNQRNLGFLGA